MRGYALITDCSQSQVRAPQWRQYLQQCPLPPSTFPAMGMFAWHLQFFSVMLSIHDDFAVHPVNARRELQPASAPVVTLDRLLMLMFTPDGNPAIQPDSTGLNSLAVQRHFSSIHRDPEQQTTVFILQKQSLCCSMLRTMYCMSKWITHNKTCHVRT